MYIESEDYKNIWELAHQWAGEDQQKTDINHLPNHVDLNLRRLAAAILSRDLKARTKSVAVFVDESLIDFLFSAGHVYKLWKSKTGSSFNKEYLQSLFIKRPDFLAWIEQEKLPPTDFWILTQVIANHKVSNRPKNEAEDKAVCRAIAKTYWDIDENIHPAHMAECKAIKKYGNGAHYEINTIKEWISDLDPLAKIRKTGRPKQIVYKVNLETGSLLAS